MKTIYILLVYITFTSCNKKNALELEIITKEINSLNYDGNYNVKMLNDDLYLKKSKTIIIYKLINNDTKTYYFNLNYFHSQLTNSINGLSINKSFINFSKNNGKNMQIRYGIACKDSSYQDEFKDKNNFVAKSLNYSIEGNEKFLVDNSNFVIHPNEVLYFEWFLNLPYGNQIPNYTIKFEKGKKYSAEIVMFSDSINYKQTISRTDLKTIKDNGYEVYHGIIKSKNKIPIKFVD